MSWASVTGGGQRVPDFVNTQETTRPREGLRGGPAEGQGERESVEIAPAEAAQEGFDAGVRIGARRLELHGAEDGEADAPGEEGRAATGEHAAVGNRERAEAGKVAGEWG